MDRPVRGHPRREGGLSAVAGTRLVLARHAEAGFVEDWFSDEGGSLTALGREQASALADSLAGRGVVAVVTSDTSRAVQTGEICAARLGTDVTARTSLREVFLGDLIGCPFDVGLIEAVTDRWYAGYLDARFTGGESGHQVIERHRCELADVASAYPDGTVLVVGHQTALGIVLPSLVPGITPDHARRHPLANAETLELEVGEDSWELEG